MLNHEHLHKITTELKSRLAQLGQPLPNSQLLQDLIQEALSKLDLVTRSDYERLLQIQQNTRAKVDALNAALTNLESQLAAQPNSTNPPLSNQQAANTTKGNNP